MIDDKEIIRERWEKIATEYYSIEDPASRSLLVAKLAASPYIDTSSAQDAVFGYALLFADPCRVIGNELISYGLECTLERFGDKITDEFLAFSIELVVEISGKYHAREKA